MLLKMKQSKKSKPHLTTPQESDSQTPVHSN
jgi:hypothetical protein